MITLPMIMGMPPAEKSGVPPFWAMSTSTNP